MTTVFNRVRRILVDLLGVSEAQILLTTTFVELSVDSLDLVEIVIRIEDEFAGEYKGSEKQFEISNEQAKSIVAVSNIVEYLMAKGIRDQ